MNARTTDPATSKAAAHESAYRLTMANTLLATIAANRGGLTAEEAAGMSGLLIGNHYTKRVSDLKNKGLIEPLRRRGALVTRKTLSNREAQVYVITALGRTEIKAAKAKAKKKGN